LSRSDGSRGTARRAAKSFRSFIIAIYVSAT